MALDDAIFFLGFGLFSGAKMLVLGRLFFDQAEIFQARSICGKKIVQCQLCEVHSTFVPLSQVIYLVCKVLPCFFGLGMIPYLVSSPERQDVSFIHV